MSISIAKRQAACQHFIRNGFNAEKTVAWVLKEYAHDDSVCSAKYPERLARNVITMGGSGDQKEMNTVAFQNALNLFIAEERERAVAVLQKENIDHKAEIRLLREQRAADHVTERTMNDRLSALQEEKASLTQTLAQAQLPAPVM